ncbi:MAG: hypothetical protein IT329_05535, partial [Caldilineaceae bacterium]|nr:hypothetical protein [Caldilineaceae bacterium]
QTRVYRQTGDGWRRTPPSAALWGEVRRLETNHFVFDYRQLDEDAVKASAAHLERLYPAFYAAFLSGPLPAQPRAIQVDPGHAPGDFTLWQRVQTPIVVASPAAYLTPGDVTPEELLTQAIVLRLLDDFEYQLALQYEGPYLREYEQYSMAIPLWPVVSGVALWQLWASDLPLAQWRVSVVQRIFADRQLDPGQPYVEPAFTLELCAMHGLWMKSPIEFHLPFACDARFEQSVVIQRWLESRPRGSSTSLPLTNRYITVSDPLVSTRAAALATMVEYAAATYGPERIPRLLETMDKYDRWEPLVVEVFGVSAETFEAGWADYLAAHYGLTIFTRGSGTPMH